MLPRLAPSAIAPSPSLQASHRIPLAQRGQEESLATACRGIVRRLRAARIGSLWRGIAMMSSVQDHRDIRTAIDARNPGRRASRMSAPVGHGITRLPAPVAPSSRPDPA